MKINKLVSTAFENMGYEG